jgi:hypothetical protein
LPDLIKFFGGLIAFAGAAGIALAVYLKFDPQTIVAMPSPIHTAVYGMSVLISGTLLYGVGAAVDHLRAIRDYQRRQIEIFERMGKNRGASANGPRSLAESSSPIVREDGRPAIVGGEGAPPQEDGGQLELLRKRAS